MIVKSVTLLPLREKYYTTNIVVETDQGPIFLEFCGGNWKPSQREIDKGWEPDYGMDHVESEYTYELAKKIVEALSK